MFRYRLTPDRDACLAELSRRLEAAGVQLYAPSPTGELIVDGEAFAVRAATTASGYFLYPLEALA